MPDEAPPKKRMGRPPKSPEKGRRQNYTFRMSDADRDKVVAAAEAAGRSISEEIERRIEDSFSGALSTDIRTKGLFEAIAQMIFMVERATEKKWWEDEISASMCGDAVRELINSLMPKYNTPRNKLLSLVESDKDRVEREAKEALWHTKLEMNAIDRAIRILQGEPEADAAVKAVDKLSQSKKTSATK